MSRLKGQKLMVEKYPTGLAAKKNYANSIRMQYNNNMKHIKKKMRDEELEEYE